MPMNKIGSNCPTEEKNVAQIEDQIKQLNNAVDGANELRQRLEDRLSSIIRPAMPTATPASTVQDLVPLAEELREIRNKIMDLSDALIGMLDRIEL